MSSLPTVLIYLSQLSSLRDESCSPRIIVLNCTTREWERDGWSSATASARERREERHEASAGGASEVESPKYSLDEVKAITHPGFGGPGRERYSLAI